MTPKTFSVDEALRFGWETTKRNFVLILSFLLVAGLIPSLAARIAGVLRENFPVYALILDLGSWVLGIVLEMGLLRVALKIADGQKPELSDLLAPYPFFFNYLLAGILYGLIFVAGLLLFIVPGLIWAVKFWPFAYLVVDRKTGPLEALAESSKLTAGVKTELFLFLLALLGINLIGVLLFGVGLLVSIPVSMISAAWVYRRLSQ